MKLFFARKKHRIPVQNESHISTLFTTNLTSSFLHIKLLQLRMKISSYDILRLFIIFILFWMYNHKICVLSKDFEVPHGIVCISVGYTMEL